MEDVIVIGGGPGGIAAAAYCMQLGLRTTIVSPELGGKTNEPFTLNGVSSADTVRGVSLVRSLAAQLPPDCHYATTATHIVADSAAGAMEVMLENGQTLTGRTLIYAAGVESRKLYIPGERKFLGRGVSYSVVSHAALCRGRNVAVLGNHRRAHLAVLTLARVARSVLFIIPYGSPADTINPNVLAQFAQYDNILTVHQWELVSLEGTTYLERLMFQNAEGNSRHMWAEVLFVELPLLPNTALLAGLVTRNEQGHICVNQHCATSHPRIFAVGDASDVHSEQVPIAIGEGIKAALSVSEWIGFDYIPTPIAIPTPI
jgi:alkyl hydroperoxide reductase subunit F